MTNSESIIVDLEGIANILIREDLCSITPIEKAMESLEENDKLKAEIEQLKSELEQSVKLPCKVGDKLFSTENGYIEEFKVRSLNHIANLVEFSRFDETVFLTREEAEQSLKSEVDDSK